MRRRDFVTISGLAAAGFALPRATAKSMMVREKEKVIIIGAGMAGLAAADTLRNATGYDVTILEARQRIGGRVNSDSSLGVTVDLGGSWIHGTFLNPLNKLTKRFGAKTVKTDYDHIYLYDSNGKKLADGDVEELDEAWEEVLEDAWRSMRSLGSGVSIGKAVDYVLKGEKLTPIEQRFLAWRKATLEIATAADLDDVSLSADADAGYEGNDLFLPKGFISLVEPLSRGLDIRLGHIVKKIEWSQAGVKVTTTGTPNRALCNACHDHGLFPDNIWPKTAEGDEKVFEADRVIVTLPLGVLQAGINGDGPKFSPELPKEKIEAIEGLNIADANKVAMLFEKRFWPKKPHFFGVLGDPGKGYPTYQNYFMGLDEPVLVGFAGGNSIRSRELLSDADTVALAMAELRKMFGDSIPEPSRHVVTRWHSDPFAVGSYSYVPAGTKTNPRKTLRKPVGDSLFFAGEAASTEDPGTVTGAYMSGVAEAKRIIGLA